MFPFASSGTLRKPPTLIKILSRSFFFSGPRMALRYHILQLFLIDKGIALGSGEELMAQKLLYHTGGAASFEKV
jgi:hypothetical protein